MEFPFASEIIRLLESLSVSLSISFSFFLFLFLLFSRRFWFYSILPFLLSLLLSCSLSNPLFICSCTTISKIELVMRLLRVGVFFVYSARVSHSFRYDSQTGFIVLFVFHACFQTLVRAWRNCSLWCLSLYFFFLLVFFSSKNKFNRNLMVKLSLSRKIQKNKLKKNCA